VTQNLDRDAFARTRELDFCITGVARRGSTRLSLLASWNIIIRPRTEQFFTVLFAGQLSPIFLANDSFYWKHEKLGSLNLFLVPLGAGGRQHAL